MDIHGAVFSFFGMHNAQPKPTFSSTYYDTPILAKFYVRGLRGEPLDKYGIESLDDPDIRAGHRRAYALGLNVAKRVSRRVAKRWGARILKEERRWERRDRDTNLHGYITGFSTPGYTSFIENPLTLLADYYAAYFTRKDAMYEPIRAMNPPGWARIPMHMATVSVNPVASDKTSFRPGDSVVSRDTRPVMTPASHDSEHVAPAIWGPHGYYDVSQGIFRQPNYGWSPLRRSHFCARGAQFQWQTVTSEEAETLPEGTPVLVTWSGGNGPHEYKR